MCECLCVIPDKWMHFVTQVFWTSCTTQESEMYSQRGYNKNVVQGKQILKFLWVNFSEPVYGSLRGTHKRRAKAGEQMRMRKYEACGRERNMKTSTPFIWHIFRRTSIKDVSILRFRKLKLCSCVYSYSHYLSLELQPH